MRTIRWLRRLLPDDFAAQQQAEVVLEDADHVGAEAAVRLAAEVGDVDGDPPPGSSARTHSANTSGAACRGTRVRRRHTLALQLLLVLLAGKYGAT